MTPAYDRDGITLYEGNSLKVLAELPDESIHSCVTDPPYGLSFMGKSWDYDVPKVELWREVHRVLKPGAHLLSFFGTRTYHRGVVQIEDAGFEIRDQLAWVFGSGFPKSLDVSKAIDKDAGVERGKIKTKARNPKTSGGGRDGTPGATRPFIEKALKENNGYHEIDDNIPITDAAKEWQGWGTALKPAWEPIVLARKPLAGTVAENVQEHGCGGLNINECRIPAEKQTGWGGGGKNAWAEKSLNKPGVPRPVDGRWPANLCHDGSEEVIRAFPGDESRFFASFKKDETCSLCGLTLSKSMCNDDSCKQLHANSAGRNLKIIQATIESIAPKNVTTCLVEKIALRVPYAESLCDSCATVIALGLVGIKTSAFSQEELRHILASIWKSGSEILHRSLVSFAELWVNIDIIPTTESLSILCGSVLHAIERSIRLEKRAVAVGDNAQEKETRFLYSSKASQDERDAGLQELPDHARPTMGSGIGGQPDQNRENNKNFHPTVKPLDLMRWLVRLVTPPKGIVLDPFLGSGTTAIAAYQEGFKCIGVEMSPQYMQDICIPRIKQATSQQRMF